MAKERFMQGSWSLKRKNKEKKKKQRVHVKMHATVRA